MTRIIIPARRLLTSLAVSGLIIVLGCSGDDLDRRYPVSGTVKFKGEPLKTGRITFSAETADGRGASGEINEGEYSLTTQDPGAARFRASTR